MSQAHNPMFLVDCDAVSPAVGRLVSADGDYLSRGSQRWSGKIGSPALCVDCARVAPTFGLGDRHAYLERRMKKLWPVPDCRIE
jgi:hypothetical protein